MDHQEQSKRPFQTVEQSLNNIRASIELSGEPEKRAEQLANVAALLNHVGVRAEIEALLEREAMRHTEVEGWRTAKRRSNDKSLSFFDQAFKQPEPTPEQQTYKNVVEKLFQLSVQVTLSELMLKKKGKKLIAYLQERSQQSGTKIPVSSKKEIQGTMLPSDITFMDHQGFEKNVSGIVDHGRWGFIFTEDGGLVEIKEGNGQVFVRFISAEEASQY